MNGIFGIETIGEDELVGVGGVVCHAQDFLRGGQGADIAVVVGVARRDLLAVVGEGHLVDVLGDLVGGQRLFVRAYLLSPRHVGALAL